MVVGGDGYCGWVKVLPLSNRGLDSRNAIDADAMEAAVSPARSEPGGLKHESLCFLLVKQRTQHDVKRPAIGALNALWKAGYS